MRDAPIPATLVVVTALQEIAAGMLVRAVVAQLRVASPTELKLPSSRVGFFKWMVVPQPRSCPTQTAHSFPATCNQFRGSAFTASCAAGVLTSECHRTEAAWEYAL